MKTILSLTIVLVSFDQAYVTTTGDTLKVKGTGSYVLELIKEDWQIVHLSATHNLVE
jgi:hypothetical protein